MRRVLFVTIALMAAVGLASAAGAGLISKTYLFKEGVTLEIGVATDDGLRVDSVRFQLPPDGGRRFMRPGDQVSAEVAVSNTATKTIKVGLAIALFDDDGRLVGVASGGTKLLPVRTGRQKNYRMVFDHVNKEASKATTFQISVESQR